MLKIYFKQAIELLKQHKLFSGIYIFGTALAIASTTIIAVVAYLDIAPLYPDENRENVYYVNHLCVKKRDERGMSISGYSIKAVNEWFYLLKNKKEVSAEYGFVGSEMVKTTKAKAELYGRYTDPAFFRVYNFNFVGLFGLILFKSMFFV
jgi:putative ABC transport system permease protein